MPELQLPNPGYPQPRGVSIKTKRGQTIVCGTRFLDTVLDGGVPTPRFVLVLPQGMDPDPALYRVETLQVAYWPPGTIICFDQVGDAQENAQRIVEQTKRATLGRVRMTRKDNP